MQERNTRRHHTPADKARDQHLTAPTSTPDFDTASLNKSTQFFCASFPIYLICLGTKLLWAGMISCQINVHFLEHLGLSIAGCIYVALWYN